jgi:hypothetical protein
MTRKPDWQSLLDAFLNEHQFDEFEYGRWDCCLFVCAALKVMTGVDPASRYRGAYSSRATARRLGPVPKIVTAVCAELGLEECPVLRAQRGDIALVKKSLGLVALNGREILLVSSKGLWRAPLSMAVRAWHV